MMRDLQGTRVVVVAGAVAMALSELAHGVLLSLGVTDEATVGPADAPAVVLGVAGAVVLLAGLVLWLRGATQNQERLGSPVEGNVWLRAILGLLLPLVGALLLFQLAARLLDASSRAVGRPHHLGAWFGLWVVAYVAMEVARVSTWVDLLPASAASVATAVTSLLALPGLHRFLRTVEAAQEQAAGVVRVPPEDAVAAAPE